MDYEYFMEQAYLEALKAKDIMEIPIGCVIVLDNKIIATGYNERNSKKNSLYHAEIIAINKACSYVNEWRLENCTLFVTVEPCPMCAGAIIQSRIKTLVYGAPNKKAGCCESIINLIDIPEFNHHVQVISGIKKDECSSLMTDFFKEFRLYKKNNPN